VADISLIEAVATERVSVERASNVLVDPKALPKWFWGVKDVTPDADYPRQGSHLAWTVGKRGKMRFDATVVTNSLPRELVQDVRTPSGRSRITHRFDALPDGECRYTKTIDVAYRGANRAFGFLFTPIIRSSAKKEVRRVLELARTSP
jgi:hypothetical protein